MSETSSHPAIFSLARFGQAQKYGYEMAIDEINAKRVLGKKIELVYQDDTSKPEVASLTVEKLAD